MKTLKEMIESARNTPARPGEIAVCAQARALVRLCAENGTPFDVAEVRDIGPCNEAGCSQWARNETVSIRRPDGKVSVGWRSTYTGREGAAEELMAEWAAVRA